MAPLATSSCGGTGKQQGKQDGRPK